VSFKEKFKKTKKEKKKKNKEDSEASGLPMLSSGAVVSVAEGGPLVLLLTASALADVPSMRTGPSTEARAGESLLGGVDEGGGMSGAVSDGSWYCCSSPTRPTTMSAIKVRSLAPASGK
jgi:hypothetical protein